MQLVNEFNTLIIPGFWNNAIFTPEWFSKFIESNKTLNVEFPVHISGSVRISTDELRFFALDNKLIFTIINPNDDVFRKIETIALKVADYLPHTPVSAFGLNYTFESNLTDGELGKIFEFQENEIMAINGYKLVNTNINRSFLKDNHTLNLKVINQGDKVRFELNFHFEINSLVKFKELFTTDIMLEYKDQAIKLLTNLYKLD